MTGKPDDIEEFAAARSALPRSREPLAVAVYAILAVWGVY